VTPYDVASDRSGCNFGLRLKCRYFNTYADFVNIMHHPLMSADRGRRIGENISANIVEMKKPNKIPIVYNTLCFHVSCQTRLNTSPKSRFISTPIRL
jgi:hypothetical protein